jgi:hypothetical protein
MLSLKCLQVIPPHQGLLPALLLLLVLLRQR